ncbi:MAG TPA: hypothetical protein VKY57_16140 [Chitinispirillaceae bacterium]|nr:hypothetical protein [Chitinispirillaceae bacterium]
MNIKKLFIIMGFCAVASFAQPSDTASKQDPPKTEINVKEQKEQNKEVKGLKKSLIVNKTPTTWTKIKDLFM